MDSEDYTQYPFDKENITEEMLFISEATEGLQVMMADGVPLGLALPQSVTMQITETAPSIKGASASARTKPAEFASGLTIQVPEHIPNGDTVKIHTAEKRFMGRAE